jgi:pimeloyl-ACP methyl ester carboxylesterase
MRASHSRRESDAMSATAPATLTHVTSPDGTKIAVFVSGTGRPLVVVHGTTADHTTWRLVLPLLEPHAAVHAVDRRGRGGSGDSLSYSLARETADIAAVVDAAAAAAGSPVDLLGHSYGGNSAFGGAVARTANIRKLVLYEGWPAPNIEHRTTPPDVMHRLDGLLAQGRSEQLLETFYRDIVMMSETEISDLKAAPTWAARVAAAGTVPRELRAFGAQAFEPEMAEKITIPVLLLVGANSPDEVKADPHAVAAALPDVRIHVLDGQRHIAHFTDPYLFAEEALSFLRD